MGKALVLSDLSLSVSGHTVLKNLNIEVDNGEIFAVCGDARSGRSFFPSLILRSYTGEHKLSGKLLVNDVETELLDTDDLFNFRTISVGIVPSEISSDYSAHMTGEEYITVPFEKSKIISKRDAIIEAKHLLTIMGVKKPERVLSRKTSELKKTELRALYHVAAFIASPSLIILNDEGGKLAKEVEEQIMNMLIKICKIKNTALLLLTDNLSFAEQYSENYIVLKDGVSVLPIEDPDYTEMLRVPRLFSAYSALTPLEDTVLDCSGAIIGDVAISGQLHKKEIWGMNTREKKASAYICGERRLSSGSILKNGASICSLKPNLKGVYPVGYGTLSSFPASKSLRNAIKDCCETLGVKSLKDRAVLTESVLEASGFAPEAKDFFVSEIDRYDGIRLGFACAAAAHKDIIVIDCSRLNNSLSLNLLLRSLSDLCEHFEMSAIIISDDGELLHRFSNIVFE